MAKPQRVQLAQRNDEKDNHVDATIDYVIAAEEYAEEENRLQRDNIQTPPTLDMLSSLQNNYPLQVNAMENGIIQEINPMLDGGYSFQSQMTYPSLARAQQDIKMEGSGQWLGTDKLGYRFIDSQDVDAGLLLPSHPSHLNYTFRGAVYNERSQSNVGFLTHLGDRTSGGLQVDSSIIANPQSSGAIFPGGTSLVFFEIAVTHDTDMGKTTMVIKASSYGDDGNSNPDLVTFGNVSFINGYYGLTQGNPGYSGTLTITGDSIPNTIITPRLFNCRVYHIDYLAGDVRHKGF